MRRRERLHLTGAAGALAVAGCVSGDDGGGTADGHDDDGTSDDEPAPNATATPDPEGDDDPPADSGEEDGQVSEELGEHEYDHPGEAVEAFIVAWQEGDVEAANALLYEDGELEPIEKSPEEMVANAPEIETLARPDIDGEMATVETLLAVPEEDDPYPLMFELTTVDGAWLISNLFPGDKEVAPTSNFDVEFDDGELTLMHVAGDSVPADELFVRGDGLSETGAWHELSDDVDADEDVTAGSMLTVAVEDEYTIDLVWDDGENVAVLHSHSGARETASDGPGAVDSHLEHVDNYDGTIEDVTGADEVVVLTGELEDADQTFAFDPPAIRVDEGTTVVWEWVGEDGAHNVAHVNGEFESDVMDGEGETFSYTFDEAGTYLYVCQPHRALGMKGAVVVE